MCNVGVCALLVFFVSMRLMRVRRMIDAGVCRLYVRSVGRENVHLDCGKAAAAHLAHLQARAHIQRSGCFLQAGEGNARIHQGAQQHVAADAGKALQITSTHRKVILNRRLCPAPRQHFNGQDGVHGAGAKPRAIKRHVLEAGQPESGSDRVEHLHREGARQLGARNLHAGQLAVMANAQLAKAQLAQALLGLFYLFENLAESRRGHTQRAKRGRVRPGGPTARSQRPWPARVFRFL